MNELPLSHRWICQAQVLPSTLKEYKNPAGTSGAYVAVVADAESKEAFIEKVRTTLENKMKFPVVDIGGVEILTPSCPLSEKLQHSIETLLPVFPIAFGSFLYYEEIEYETEY
jgi:hypothetical protein